MNKFLKNMINRYHSEEVDRLKRVAHRLNDTCGKLRTESCDLSKRVMLLREENKLLGSYPTITLKSLRSLSRDIGGDCQKFMVLPSYLSNRLQWELGNFMVRPPGYGLRRKPVKNEIGAIEDWRFIEFPTESVVGGDIDTICAGVGPGNLDAMARRDKNQRHEIQRLNVENADLKQRRILENTEFKARLVHRPLLYKITEDLEKKIKESERRLRQAKKNHKKEKAKLVVDINKLIDIQVGLVKSVNDLEAKLTRRDDVRSRDIKNMMTLETKLALAKGESEKLKRSLQHTSKRYAEETSVVEELQAEVKRLDFELQREQVENALKHGIKVIFPNAGPCDHGKENKERFKGEKRFKDMLFPPETKNWEGMKGTKAPPETSKPNHTHCKECGDVVRE